MEWQNKQNGGGTADVLATQGNLKWYWKLENVCELQICNGTFNTIN
jgi:hypothetical protein